jgi:histone-lysine N-methyltransferase EZH2
MKLQLRQHKHLLLGRSSVSGWGAFVKARREAHIRVLVADICAQESVKKNELLGEYTGELISQVCRPRFARCGHSALTLHRHTHR